MKLNYLRENAFLGADVLIKIQLPQQFHYYHFELLNSMWERKAKIVLQMSRSRISSITDHEKTSHHKGFQTLLIRHAQKHLGPLFTVWATGTGKITYSTYLSRWVPSYGLVAKTKMTAHLGSTWNMQRVCQEVLPHNHSLHSWSRRPPQGLRTMPGRTAMHNHPPETNNSCSKDRLIYLTWLLLGLQWPSLPSSHDGILFDL